jgi:hypothetical protein
VQGKTGKVPFALHPLDEMELSGASDCTSRVDSRERQSVSQPAARDDGTKPGTTKETREKMEGRGGGGVPLDSIREQVR